MVSLAAANDDSFALAQYAKAVAQSRSNNLDGVIAGLRGAFNLDPELKSKALNDLEFRNYAANAAFTEVLK